MRFVGEAICGLAAILALQTPQAAAQDFPARTVRFIVPTTPGANSEVLARLFAQNLQELWNKPVVIEYKPGGGMVLGTDYVAKSAPDGYTVGMVATAHVINPSLLPNMPFNTVRDLSGVALHSVSHVVILASPAFEANSLAEAIALAKKRPGKLSYASGGTGTSMHLAGELLKSMAGIDVLHVPYKGTNMAYLDVMGGRIQLLPAQLYASMPYINSGKLKAIAVTSRKRAPTLPDVPTVSETVPGYEVTGFNGMVVPSATPRSIVLRLNADIGSLLKRPAFSKKLQEMGLEPQETTPEQFDAYIRAEIEKWAPIVKASGAKAD